MAREASGEAGGIGQFIAIIALAVFAGATLFTWCGQIGAPKVFDYSPILAPTLRVADGGPLYCDFRTTSLVPMLYGPIVPFVAAHLSHVFGHGAVAVLAAGRSITILSTLMVCALVFSLAQFTGASRLSSAIAALGFMISPLVQLWGFEFRADMPALAFNLAGVFAFETGLCPLAIVLFAGAFFAKQGQFYGIATIVLSLCIGRDFRRAATIGAAWAIVTGVVIAVMQCVTPWYWLNTFGALAGYYDISAPLSLLRHNIVLNAMLVLLGGCSLFRFGLNQMGCLFLLALAENSMDSLRWGSNFYYFLPTSAAILAPAALDSLFDWADSRRVAFQVMCGVFVAITFSAGTVIDVVRNPSAPIAEAVRPVAVRDHCVVNYWDSGALRKLKSIDGTIIIDSPELMFVDHRSNIRFIEPMVLGAMKSHGTFDDSHLISSIRRREIAAFVFGPEGLNLKWRGRKFFWPELRDAIEANYDKLSSACVPVVMMPKRSSK